MTANKPTRSDTKSGRGTFEQVDPTTTVRRLVELIARRTAEVHHEGEFRDGPKLRARREDATASRKTGGGQ